MLTFDFLQQGTLGRLVATRHLRGVFKEIEEKFDQSKKVRVVGGFRDAAMESDVGRHAILAILFVDLDLSQGRANRDQLLVSSALCSKRRNFSLERHAQFHHFKDARNRLHNARIDAEGRVHALFANEDATALPRLNQTFRFETRYRFADDGPADAEAVCHVHLGGKPRSRRKIVAANQLRQRLADAVGEGSGNSQSFYVELQTRSHKFFTSKFFCSDAIVFAQRV